MPTIIYDKKVMYCAVEKCAITRLISYFGTTYDLGGDSEQIWYPAIDVFRSDVHLSKIDRIGYFVFAFVRNPFDRVVSHYAFSKFSNINRYDYIDFDTYCKNEHYNNMGTIVSHLDVDVDFIGKFESFKDDFESLHTLLDIELPSPHPLNKIQNPAGRRSGKHYKEFYTDELRSIIELKYKADFERFGYEW